MPGYTIRKAQVVDLEKILDLWEEFQDSKEDYPSYRKLRKDKRKSTKSFFKKGLSQKGFLVYVACAPQVIGFIFAKIGPHSPPIYIWKKQCEVHTLYIAKEYRHLRVGKKLFKTIHSVAQKNGVEVLKVGTSVSNASAISFYKKQGFKEFQLRFVQVVKKE